jgi:hypothetical protein
LHSSNWNGLIKTYKANCKVQVEIPYDTVCINPKNFTTDIT